MLVLFVSFVYIDKKQTSVTEKRRFPFFIIRIRVIDRKQPVFAHL